MYKRTNHGHRYYDTPDDSLPRPMVLVCDEDYVPPTHIKTNLRNVGKTLADFRRWLATK